MARDAKDGRSSASWTDDEKSYQAFKVRSLRSIRRVGGPGSQEGVCSPVGPESGQRRLSAHYRRERGGLPLPGRVFCARETARGDGAGLWGTNRNELAQNERPEPRPWNIPVDSCPEAGDIQVVRDGRTEMASNGTSRLRALYDR